MSAEPFPYTSRRAFLQRSSVGFGWLALTGLLAERARANGVLQAHHHPPRAKRVVFCFMDGGVSHVDSFDHKPALDKFHETAITDEHVTKLAQGEAGRLWMRSPWEFKQRGESGLWVSELFPHLARHADKLCVVRSIVGQQPLHGQQNLLLHTGKITGGAPSMGAWVSYGLGCENENLPGYILLNNDWIPNGGYENFSSAFLPASHSATLLRAKGKPVDNIEPADPLALQRAKLDLLRAQDSAFAELSGERAAIEAAIRNHEMAFRMQTLVPELAEISGETAETQQLYGLDSENEYQRFYGLQCLRARRLLEAGARFIEITCPLTHANNSPWDQHGDLKQRHAENALITDQGVAALITDLDRRGMLDDTIVLWAGEMGRTPHTRGPITERSGRDHHVNGYSLFLAGGGFRGGMAYGATNDFGQGVVEHPLMIHDIHATILHQLGVDHERLTFRFGGRDMRLTDVHGHVLRELLA